MSFFLKIREVCFFLCFKMNTKRSCSQFKQKMDAKCPNGLVLNISFVFLDNSPDYEMHVLLILARNNCLIFYLQS